MSEKISYSEDFIAYQQNFVMCSKFTVDRYKSLFRTLHVNNDWCRSMDYEEARDIICSFIDKGIKPSSVNVYLSMLKKFFNYLVLRSCVQYNPFQRIKRLKQPSLMPKFISYLDMRKIYDYKWNDSPLDKEDKFCIHMLLDYGLTVSELCFLKVKNINIENKSIEFITKNKEAKRFIPMLKEDVEFFERLVTLLSPEDSILPQRLLSVYNIRYMVNRRLALIIGKPAINPSMLRNTFAMVMAANGTPIHIIKFLLGLESIKSSKLDVRLGILSLKETYFNCFSRDKTTALSINENKPQYCIKTFGNNI